MGFTFVLKRALDVMALEAVKQVSDGQLIGLGSGSAVSRFVQALGRAVKKDGLRVRVVPSSLQIQILAEQAGLEVAPSSLIPHLHLTVDGADQVDRSFNMIKGGGGALFRERVLLEAAKKRVVLADDSKFTETLNGPVPVEASPFARAFVEKRLKSLDGAPSLRLLEKGYPYITENGNVILDTDFGLIREPAKLAEAVKAIPGVVAVGIFTDMVDVCYRARSDGRVRRIDVKRSSSHRAGEMTHIGSR